MMIIWPYCFGPMVRHHIMAEAHGREKPFTSQPDHEKGKEEFGASKPPQGPATSQ